MVLGRSLFVCHTDVSEEYLYPCAKCAHRLVKKIRVFKIKVNVRLGKHVGFVQFCLGCI